MSTEYLVQASKSESIIEVIELMVKSVLLSNWSQSGALVAGIKISKDLNLNDPDVQKAFKTGALFGACAAISDNIIKEVWEDFRKKGYE